MPKIADHRPAHRTKEEERQELRRAKTHTLNAKIPCADLENSVKEVLTTILVNAFHGGPYSKWTQLLFEGIPTSITK